MSSQPATTRASGSASPMTGDMDLSKAQRKILSSLGHQIVRFAAACDRLRIKQSSYPELAPWLQPAQAWQATAITSSGVFACQLTLDATRLVLHPIIASAAQCDAALQSLQSAAQEQTEVLAPPASLNESLWLALLHLRPLRDFWERELRRATVDSLLDLLPDAWLLDPTPLPPGSVIPRLEIASWNDLNFSSRKFIPATPAELANCLSAYPDAPGVLTSPPDISPGAVSFLSFYLKSETRVDWLGVVGRQPSADLSL
ncbi:MAG: hypothetical protein K8R87_11050 [Verrucomicrobia bacterium]|nr:hypothetical protein [Verrucomicrobiota bacterium]